MATYEDLSTGEMVQARFDEVSGVATAALESTRQYMGELESLLNSFTAPDTSALENITITDPGGFNVEMPLFSDELLSFPGFNSERPTPPTEEKLPEISADIDTENFNFQGNTITVPIIDPITEKEFDYTGSPPTAPTISEIPTKNFNFNPSIPSKPSISYGKAPEGPSLTSVESPPAPEIDFPDAPTLDDLVMPEPRSMDIAKFTATTPEITEPTPPATTSFTEVPYNSDIAVELFGKILYDIKNGGTGLAVSVEEDLYNRYLARQITENDRLFQEVQDQFSANGFALPSGAVASRLLQVSNDISVKNDQANREISINQAELAQKNTHFTIEQAGILEKMLRDFFDGQQNRALQAHQVAAENAIAIYNAVIARQGLSLEKYKTEAQVFESKIRAELTAVEIYKGQVEGVKAKADVQNARAAIYNAQLSTVETKAKIYATQMESTKLQAELETLKVELFKAQTESYVAQVSAETEKTNLYKAEVAAEGARVEAHKAEISAYATETSAKMAIEQGKVDRYKAQVQAEGSNIDAFRAKVDAYAATTNAKTLTEQGKVDVYKSQVDAEGHRVNTHKAKIEAYDTKIRAKIGEIEAKKAELEGKVALNQAKIDGYRAEMEGYRAEIDGEVKEANLAVAGYQTSVTAFQAQAAAKEAELRMEMSRYSAQIEVLKARVEKAKALIDSTVNSYVALKELQAKGTEGIMNTSAQLAASAMNAVNASASRGVSFGYDDSFSETHTYKHTES